MLPFTRGLLPAVLLSLACLAGCRSTVSDFEWARPRSIVLPSPVTYFQLLPLAEFHAIEAEFEDLGPYPILFDTGSALLIISDDISQALLASAPRDTGPVIASWLGEEEEIGRFYRIASARLGPVRLRDVSVNAVDFSEWEKDIGRAPRGIVGVQPFYGKFLTVDFRTGEMWVRDQAPSSLPPDDASVPFQWGLGTVNGQISVAGKKIWAVIDSGSSLGLQIPRREDLPILGDWGPSSVARDAFGTKQYFTAELDADVTIGGTLLPGPWVYSSPEFPQANVGMEVLRHFRMTLDTKNGRLWLEGPEDKRIIVERPEPSKSKQTPTPPSESEPDR